MCLKIGTNLWYDITICNIIPIMILSDTDNDIEAASTEMYNIISHY